MGASWLPLWGVPGLGPCRAGQDEWLSPCFVPSVPWAKSSKPIKANDSDCRGRPTAQVRVGTREAELIKM